ncbi:unnamed protein product [Rotaria socialis]|uniref:Uncharacterized protein n=1 Tax=Rotaria socialis TaxID=392032 RepID=A0A820KR74_9BILA|nr:unnamed protein product [Rotaria socialis]
MLPIYELFYSPDQQSEVSAKKTFSIWRTFKHHIPHFLIAIVVDIILPLVIYFILQKHTKPVYALLAAGTPPLVMVITKAILFCTFDALGFLVFTTFAITGIVVVITRNPIVLLLEKSVITGIISIIFAITLIPFHCCHHRCSLRPVGYYMYQDLVPTNREDVGLPEHIFCDQQEQVDSRYTDLQEEVSSRKVFHKEEVVQVYDWIYKNCSSFRLSCIIITSIWAIGLLFEFLARLFLIIFHLPVNKIVIYGHVILSSITVICIVSTITCIAIERKHTLLFIETKQLITQQSFGSVFHQPSDSTTDETDDDDDENPLSDKCSDSGEAKNILHDTKCGLFINERYMNIPAEISLPAIRTLRLEMSFELDYWIVHAKLRLHTSDTSTIYYVNGEEEIFQQYPSLSIDYNPTQSNNNNNNNGWTHRRKIIFVSTYKLDEICSNIEQKLKK